MGGYEGWRSNQVRLFVGNRGSGRVGSSQRFAGLGRVGSGRVGSGLVRSRNSDPRTTASPATLTRRLLKRPKAQHGGARMELEYRISDNHSH